MLALLVLLFVQHRRVQSFVFRILGVDVVFEMPRRVEEERVELVLCFLDIRKLECLMVSFLETGSVVQETFD